MSDRSKSTSLKDSPFYQLLGNSFEELPRIFRLQYFFSPEDAHTDTEESLLFTGQAKQIWHRYPLLKPCFHLLSPWNILFSEAGEDIPAEMRITKAGQEAGKNTYWWRRVFSFSTPRRFDAYIYFDQRKNAVIERLGPGPFFELSWEIEFSHPNELKVSSKDFYFAWGSNHFKVPNCLSPKAAAIEKALSDDKLEVDFRLHFPLLGEVFGFGGEFTVIEQP